MVQCTSRPAVSWFTPRMSTRELRAPPARRHKNHCNNKDLVAIGQRLKTRQRKRAVSTPQVHDLPLIFLPFFKSGLVLGQSIPIDVVDASLAPTFAALSGFGRARGLGRLFVATVEGAAISCHCNDGGKGSPGYRRLNSVSSASASVRRPSRRKAMMRSIHLAGGSFSSSAFSAAMSGGA